MNTPEQLVARFVHKGGRLQHHRKICAQVEGETHRYTRQWKTSRDKGNNANEKGFYLLRWNLR